MIGVYVYSSKTRFTDSVNTTNSAMLILELRNVIRFERCNEYLILSFVCKFESHVYAM